MVGWKPSVRNVGEPGNWMTEIFLTRGYKTGFFKLLELKVQLCGKFRSRRGFQQYQILTILINL